MARPYESPPKRMRRMRQMGDMGDSPAPTSEDVAPAAEPMEESPATEPAEGAAEQSATAFLPSTVTGGKTFRAGDEIVLSVVDVDPETGELEVKYASESGDSGPDIGERMDAAMPEEQPS